MNTVRESGSSGISLIKLPEQVSLCNVLGKAGKLFKILSSHVSVVSVVGKVGRVSRLLRQQINMRRLCGKGGNRVKPKPSTSIKHVFMSYGMETGALFRNPRNCLIPRSTTCFLLWIRALLIFDMTMRMFPTFQFFFNQMKRSLNLFPSSSQLRFNNTIY